MRRPGMKNGLTRRGPFSFSSKRRLGDAVEPADARADQDAGALLLLRRIGLPARVLERLRRPPPWRR